MNRNIKTGSCILRVLVTIAFTSIFIACTDRNIRNNLAEAESLVTEYPDSATAILLSMDTTGMSASQIDRRELLYAYVRLIQDNQIPLDSAVIIKGDETFNGAFNKDEVKWLLLKSSEAKRTGNPVSRIETLKDAEFLAIQLNDSIDLGVIYLFLSNVYQQGYNGTVSKYYADKAFKIFEGLRWKDKMREARMAVVGAYAVKRDYKTMLDSLMAMEPEVMANATDSYKSFFLDQLARGYDTDGQTRKAIDIWHSIYDGKDISSNTLAHWAHAYYHINKLDSAYMLIQRANRLHHNHTDEYLCRNVEHDIIEKMGRTQELARIDSLREVAADSIFAEKRLEDSSLALNMKYDSETRQAWIDASEARHRTNIAILIAIVVALAGIAIYIYLRKRNQMLRLEHENDLLKIRAIQDNLFESDNRNKDISARISDLFQTRFRLIDSLAATYFECKDTGQEQKRIYADVRSSLSNFSSKESTQELTDIVNGYNDNLMAKFKEDFPKLPESQSRLALYLFCGFSLQSISIFTGTELRNLYVYKSRLKSAILKSDSRRKEKYLGYF